MDKRDKTFHRFWNRGREGGLAGDRWVAGAAHLRRSHKRGGPASSASKVGYLRREASAPWLSVCPLDCLRWCGAAEKWRRPLARRSCTQVPWRGQPLLQRGLCA
eukprot:scaffold706_cov418-Prasinococcus_capsulatus_cf.AAC.21